MNNGIMGGIGNRWIVFKVVLLRYVFLLCERRYFFEYMVSRMLYESY